MDYEAGFQVNTGSEVEAPMVSLEPLVRSAPGAAALCCYCGQAGAVSVAPTGELFCEDANSCVERRAALAVIAEEDRANGAAWRKLLTSGKQWEVLVYADGSVVMSEASRGGGSYCFGVAGFAPMVTGETG